MLQRRQHARRYATTAGMVLAFAFFLCGMRSAPNQHVKDQTLRLPMMAASNFPVVLIHTSNNTNVLPGSLLCDYTAPATLTGCTGGSDANADMAYYNARKVYEYFAANHGR